MDVRVGLLVLLALAGNWVSDARDIADLKVSGVEEVGRRIDLCALCEEYVTVALNYLNDNKTHEDIMMALHDSCSQMRNLAEQCTVMVDRYAALFFSDVSSMQPEGFCKEVGLCKNAMVSSLLAKRNKCEVCRQAVDEVLDKLKDPDTELEIIEKLLKACNTVGDKYKSKQCKKMVFEYGPLLLVDAGSFVEKLDLCTTFHACAHQQDKTEGMIERVASS
ncbi:uncharacterized protein LOC141633563 isoform X1 [Silene latifolia]|uniref:uncharacterized protein LOC141633563 isoform X1 n=1 Tax=Silene latifolia TaxID=37657 RepID=UPI003D786A29